MPDAEYDQPDMDDDERSKGVQEHPPPAQLRLEQRSERVLYAVRICWLIILAGFILYKVLEFFVTVRTFTNVVVGAVLFAYLVFPLITRLNRRLPLGLSIAIVYVGIALLFAFGIYVIAPILSHDAQQLVHDAPKLVRDAQSALVDPNNPLTKHLPTGLRAYLISFPAQMQVNISKYGASVASTVLPVLLSIVTIGALFVIIPVVAAYLMMEAEGLKRTLMGFIPQRAQQKTLKIIADLDHVVGGFIRGQLIVAAIVGTLVTVLLLVLHVQYAALIGAVAGILDVIPYIGAIAGWLPAFFIALFTNGVENALLVTLGIVVINQLEGHIIAPNVVSKSVELTPLAVVLALLAGGELAGIPGLLLAVPVAGIIRVLVINFRPPPVGPAVAQPALRKVPKKPFWASWRLKRRNKS
jgi:predicted PurR-regulated permease PerM